MNDFSFPRGARIRLTRDFAFVRQKGRSVQGRFLRMTAVHEGHEPRFGIVTSKRVGNAVVRNRVRRRLREICRLHRPELRPDAMVVVVAKPAGAAATFQELHEEWLILARRLSIFHAPC